MLNAIPSPNVLLKAFDEVKPNLILMVPLIIEKIYLKKILPTISKPLISSLLKLPIISSILKSNKMTLKISSYTDANGSVDNYLCVVDETNGKEYGISVNETK